MTILFICSTLLLAYSFVLYPLIIHCLAKKLDTITDNHEVDTIMPSVTVLMAVHNGEHNLEERIRNIFGCNYPAELIDCVVVSDGSTDNTREVLSSIQQLEQRVRYIHYDENKGKAYALSTAFKYLKSDVVVFCDVRQTFEENAIMNLVQGFTDDSVGAITGNLIITESDGNSQADPGLYWKYEKWIRQNEGVFHSLLGVTGAIYAARRKSLPMLIPDNTILDDMYVPLHMVKQGLTIKMAENAIAYDVPSSTLKEEFTRKVRTLAGNFQLMRIHPWINFPVFNPVFFQWVSHKVTRLLVPYALIGVMISTSIGNTPLLNTAFVLQWVCYIYALIAYLAMNRNKNIKFGSVFVSFCSLNFAAFLAGWKYKFSQVESLWHKH